MTKNNKRINLKEIIKTHIDAILDVLYYIAFLGIVAAVLVLAWGPIQLGIRLLVSFLLLMGLVIYLALRTDGTDDKKEENKRGK